MTDAKEILALKAVIRALHGAHSEHTRSVPITETFRGTTVWAGVVEVFELRDHPAKMAYAWSHESDSGGRRFVAVLHVVPVDSPRKAVQVAVLHEASEQARTR